MTKRKAAPRLTIEVAGLKSEHLSSEVTIGRSRDCDIRLERPDVSRLHVRVRFDGTSWWVVDTSSSGTWVDGIRVTEPRRLGARALLNLSSADGPSVGLELRPPEAVRPRKALLRWVAMLVALLLAVGLGVYMKSRPSVETAESPEEVDSEERDRVAPLVLDQPGGSVTVVVSEIDPTTGSTTVSRMSFSESRIASIAEIKEMGGDAANVAEGDGLSVTGFSTADAIGYTSFVIADGEGATGVLIGRDSIAQLTEDEGGSATLTVRILGDSPAMLVATSESSMPAGFRGQPRQTVSSVSAWYCGKGVAGIQESADEYDRLIGDLIQLNDEYAQVLGDAIEQIEDLASYIDLSGLAKGLFDRLPDPSVLESELLKFLPGAVVAIVLRALPDLPVIPSEILGKIGLGGARDVTAAGRVTAGTAATWFVTALTGIVLAGLNGFQIPTLFTTSKSATEMRAYRDLMRRTMASADLSKPNAFQLTRTFFGAMQTALVHSSFFTSFVGEPSRGVWANFVEKCPDVPPYIAVSSRRSLDQLSGDAPMRVIGAQDLTVLSGCPDDPCTVSFGEAGTITLSAGEGGASLPSETVQVECRSRVKPGKTLANPGYSVTETWTLTVDTSPASVVPVEGTAGETQAKALGVFLDVQFHLTPLVTGPILIDAEKREFDQCSPGTAQSVYYLQEASES